MPCMQDSVRAVEIFMGIHPLSGLGGVVLLNFPSRAPFANLIHQEYGNVLHVIHWG